MSADVQPFPADWRLGLKWLTGDRISCGVLWSLARSGRWHDRRCHDRCKCRYRGNGVKRERTNSLWPTGERQLCKSIICFPLLPRLTFNDLFRQRAIIQLAWFNNGGLEGQPRCELRTVTLFGQVNLLLAGFPYNNAHLLKTIMETTLELKSFSTNEFYLLQKA